MAKAVRESVVQREGMAWIRSQGSKVYRRIDEEYSCG